MKTILLASASILLTTSVFSNELAWVDEQIEAIKPERQSSNIKNIKNPFVFLEQNGYVKPAPVLVEEVVSTTNAKGEVIAIKIVKKKPKPLLLDAIMNSSVLINGKWYKKNEKVRNYKVVRIEKSSVTLKSSAKTITLSTNVKKQTLKFKNK